MMTDLKRAAGRVGSGEICLVDRSSRGVSGDALVLIDKPSGCTSFDIVRRVRRATGVRKVGHAGTLDPLATGLLVCMVGRATKRMSSLVGLDKCYTGTIRFGASTPSYDSETDPVATTDASHLTLEDVRVAGAEFVGTIVQKSPLYSAVKLGGERLYRKARRGEKVDPPPRVVTVHELLFDRLTGTDVSFVIRCSSGTYIRSLAHDIGQAIGVGAYLSSLRRLAVGAYEVEDALSIEEVEDLYRRWKPAR